MTNKKALEYLKKNFKGKYLVKEHADAIEVAIKTLEQESCEDAISRKAAIECLRWQYPDKLPEIKIRELPSVKPKQNTGHWVSVQEYCKHLTQETGERYEASGISNYIYCDSCWNGTDRYTNFCPYCGSYNGEEVNG